MSGYSDHPDQSYHSRETSDERKGFHAIPLTPSDTSIDDSVKSGNLIKYLKHKPPRLATSDSDHNLCKWCCCLGWYWYDGILDGIQPVLFHAHANDLPRLLPV